MSTIVLYDTASYLFNLSLIIFELPLPPCMAIGVSEKFNTGLLDALVGETHANNRTPHVKTKAVLLKGTSLYYSTAEVPPTQLTRKD